VELYFQVRHAVRIEGLSERAAARRFGIDPRTVSKMLRFSVPPGYRRSKPPVRPKLGPFVPLIDRILEEDKAKPKKQQHTSKRIFERLRDEHGFTGGVTIVKDYVAAQRQRSQEVFVPLAHPPGHAQVDFGEALGVIGGVERKIHFFAFHLPHSDASFVVAYPAETTEAFLDGHVSAFAWLGGVPQSVLYDNTKIAVVKILGDGRRERTKSFTELQSHYLFEDRFGRPAKGNDKGKVEGLVGYINGLLPTNEVIGQALRKTVPMFPELAVRELVANALIHQDFSVTGAGPMVEIFADRIEITNPGVPLVDPQRFMDTPPKSRNEALASLMRRFRICEERGSGIDKVVSQVELFQLPAPLFEVPDGFTRAVLFAHKPLSEMEKADKVRACYLHACLRYMTRQPMTNTSLRERFGIEQKNSATASRLIKEATEAGVIRPYEEATSKRLMKYVPFWA